MTESEMREKIADFLSDLDNFWRANIGYSKLVDNLEMALNRLDSKIAANLRFNDPDRKRDE
jgi:hypothetical protein